MNIINVKSFFTETQPGMICPYPRRHGFQSNPATGHPPCRARPIMKRFTGYSHAVAISIGYLISVLNSTSMIIHNDENLTVITKKLRSCIADSHRYQIYELLKLKSSFFSLTTVSNSHSVQFLPAFSSWWELEEQMDAVDDYEKER